MDAVQAYMSTMTPVDTLEELEQYLRKVMPQWKAVREFTRNVRAGFIDFRWNGHHFAIKPNMQAYDVRDRKLFITAGSLLLQTALATRSSNEQVIAAVVDDLDRVVETAHTQPDEVLSATRSIKQTIQRLIGKCRNGTGNAVG